MRKANELMRLWNTGKARNRARVLSEITRGGKVNVGLLACMLESNRRLAVQSILMAYGAVA